MTHKPVQWNTFYDSSLLFFCNGFPDDLSLLQMYKHILDGLAIEKHCNLIELSNSFSFHGR